MKKQDLKFESESKFKSKEGGGTHSAQKKPRPAAMAFLAFVLVFTLVLSSCGPKAAPQPGVQPGISEEPEEILEPETVEIDGVVYEVFPLTGIPEPEEIDFAAEKEEYLKRESGYSDTYISNVRLLSYTKSALRDNYVKLETETINNEKLTFHILDSFFEMYYEPHMNKVANVLWRFEKNQNDGEIYCTASTDIFLDEEGGDFNEKKPSTYKRYADEEEHTTSGILKHVEMLGNSQGIMYVLGEDGNMYEFYFWIYTIEEYKRVPGYEIKAYWYVKDFFIEEDEGTHTKADLVTARHMVELELIGASADVQPVYFNEEGIPYATYSMPDEKDLPAAGAYEMDTDTESEFVSLVKVKEGKSTDFGQWGLLTEFEAIDKDGNILNFVCPRFAYFQFEDWEVKYVIWRNEKMTNEETGETGLYKYVIGFESSYGFDNDFADARMTTRRLYTSEKKEISGTFHSFDCGDYYHLAIVSDDGFLYSFFISGEMENPWALEDMEKGTKIKVTYREKEMYIWEAGSRVFDLQASAFSTR